MADPINSVDLGGRRIIKKRGNLKVRREYGATNYEAWALPGAADTDSVWQIAVITREAVAPHSILTKNYAQNDAGKESNAFAFAWSERAALTYGV
jgi:hypothetical protein